MSSQISLEDLSTIQLENDYQSSYNTSTMCFDEQSNIFSFDDIQTDNIQTIQNTIKDDLFINQQDDTEQDTQFTNNLQNTLFNNQKSFNQTFYQNQTTQLQDSAKHQIMKQEQMQKGILPPQQQEYTVVLDLDNTLIHVYKSEKQYQVFLRPFLMEFLEEISKIAEIIIFTASVYKYAKSIVNIIDPNKKYISYIVSREYMIQEKCQKTNQTKYFKDLSILGRNLNKTIFIDDLPQNFKKQPQNGILIKQWFSDRIGAADDTELNNLQTFIKLFISSKTDVLTVQQQQIQQSNQSQQDFQQQQTAF